MIPLYLSLIDKISCQAALPYPIYPTKRLTPRITYVPAFLSSLCPHKWFQTKGDILTRLKELQHAPFSLTMDELREILMLAQDARDKREDERRDIRSQWDEYGEKVEIADAAVTEADNIINEFISWASRAGIPTASLRSMID